MLNTAFEYGNISLKNRLVMPPMASETCVEGVPGEKTVAFYTDRAKGGKIGLIITEHCYIAKQGKASPGQLSVAEDSCIEGLKKITDAIHACGSKVICQINHAGNAARFSVTGMEALSAGSKANPRLKEGGNSLKQMDEEDIRALKEDFVAAAVRAKKAGYDGVELHSAHGYLLNQFYSPLCNDRSDGYGGALHGRIRIHLELIEAVRSAVGEDFVIAMRLGGCDYMEGGSTVEDCCEAAAAFEAAGLDMLDLSGGMCGFDMVSLGEVYFSDMAKRVKERVKLPVIVTGGITEAETAQKVLESGSADLVGVGRALLRDTDWAEKNMK